MANESFDFIVAGGGTAGLVVAARLSEDPSQRVLVLEAGGDHSADPRLITPALNTALFGTEADWAFSSTPQPNLNGRSTSLNQGRALGGSSAINAQILVPPNKSTVSGWAQLGNPGWGSDELRKYARKPYSFPKVDEVSGKVLGVGGWDASEGDGPMEVSFPGDPNHPLREAWADTFKSDGYLMSGHPYNEATRGSFSCLATIHPVTKARVYSASAYYLPAKDRENLKVLTGALVEKILFEQADGITKAKAVQYIVDGQTVTANATKEVIVAAGALQSPKLLELSGIGNASILKKHGIEVVQDLPGVGENLQDHLVCGSTYEAQDGVETLDALMRQEPEAFGKAMADYASTQTGLLTSIGLTTYAYLPVIEHLSGESPEVLQKVLEQNRPSAGQSPEEARAAAYYDIVEQNLLDTKASSSCFFSVACQVKQGSDPEAPQGPAAGSWITFAALLSQPLSRGSVHIQSNNISDAPVIDPRYLDNPVDLEVLAREMLYCQTLASRQPLTGLLKQPLKELDPKSRFISLEDAKEYVKRCAISMWHVVGSCSMLPKEKLGVVDPQLRVYGVPNLRVVDSSTMPIVSTGNTQHAVYTIAEKAADLIKETYGLK